MPQTAAHVPPLRHRRVDERFGPRLLQVGQRTPGLRHHPRRGPSRRRRHQRPATLRLILRDGARGAVGRLHRLEGLAEEPAAVGLALPRPPRLDAACGGRIGPAQFKVIPSRLRGQTFERRSELELLALGIPPREPGEIAHGAVAGHGRQHERVRTVLEKRRHADGSRQREPAEVVQRTAIALRRQLHPQVHHRRRGERALGACQAHRLVREVRTDAGLDHRCPASPRSHNAVSEG